MRVGRSSSEKRSSTSQRTPSKYASKVQLWMDAKSVPTSEAIGHRSLVFFTTDSFHGFVGGAKWTGLRPSTALKSRPPLPKKVSSGAPGFPRRLCFPLTRASGVHDPIRLGTACVEMGYGCAFFLVDLEFEKQKCSNSSSSVDLDFNH